MKTCKFCEHEMMRQNYKKHESTCFIKKTFGISKSVILSCIEQSKKKLPYQNLILEENKRLKTQASLIELLCEKAYKYLKEISIESAALILEKEGVSVQDPASRIQEMILSEGTKTEYMMEWRLYSKFCEDKRINAFSNLSANKYLQSLKVNVSTIHKKRGNLQSILTNLVGRSIKLVRIGKKSQYKLKYALTSAEIESYLEEQKEIDTGDFLIQTLLLQYGCRINTAGLIKVSHLQFLNGINKNIILPDSKTGPRIEQITPKLENLLNSHLEENPFEEDDYLFSANGDYKTERKRCHAICVRINKRIKNSKVLKKNKNYQFSSHMFRKTKAFMAFQAAVMLAKQKARDSIGQARNSSSINHYIKFDL